MLYWWLIVGVLVATAILLTLLLAPLPAALHKAVVSLIDQLQKPLWVILSIMAWVLFDTTMEMRKYQEHFEAKDTASQILHHNKKWRSERNFYLVAFGFTLLLVLVRLQSLAHTEAALSEENRHLRDLQRINQRPAAAGATTTSTDTKKSQ